MKITGFKELHEKTSQMAKFVAEIDGEIATVSFNADNPASIETALQEINHVIDEKTKSYERNDWIQNLAEQLKESARRQVLEKAASARLGSEDK